MQKPLKTQYFMNKMHEYEFKSFSKTLEFNPDLPKTIFSIILSPKLKHQTCNLGWPKQIHTLFHELNLAKNNLCSVCN